MTEHETAIATLEEQHSEAIAELSAKHAESQRETLTAFSAMIKAVDDPTIFNAIFSDNEWFVANFGEDATGWAANIDMLLAPE